MNAQQLGAKGEQYILLLGAGLDATLGGDADIAIASSGLQIEVKAARLTRRTRGTSRRWQFCLRRQGKTDYRRSDLVVCPCYRDDTTDPVLLAIPSARLNGNYSLKIPENPNMSKWSLYRGWDRAMDELEVTK